MRKVAIVSLVLSIIAATTVLLGSSRSSSAAGWQDYWLQEYNDNPEILEMWSNQYSSMESAVDAASKVLGHFKGYVRTPTPTEAQKLVSLLNLDGITQEQKWELLGNTLYYPPADGKPPIWSAEIYNLRPQLSAEIAPYNPLPENSSYFLQPERFTSITSKPYFSAIGTYPPALVPQYAELDTTIAELAKAIIELRELLKIHISQSH